MKKPVLWLVILVLSISIIAIFPLNGCKVATTTTAATTTAVETTAAETTAAETTAATTTAATTTAATTTAATTTAATTTAAETTAAQGKKVGISFPSTVAERFVTESALLQKGLVELGYEVVGLQFAYDDANKQIEQCTNMLTLGADLLIVCAFDSTSAAQIVENAHAQNVPVIAYIRMIEGDVDYMVSEDNNNVGTEEGKFMIAKVPKGNVLLLTGDPLDINAVLYHDTALAAMKSLIDKGDIKIVGDQYSKGWAATEAQKHAENALTQNNNDIQGILCTNDSTAGGAIEALAAQKLDGKVIVTGCDCELAAAKRIWAGTQTMSLLKERNLISGACVKAADELLKTGKIQTTEVRANKTKDVPSILVPMIVVTKDNFKKVLLDTNYYTLEDLGLKAEDVK